MRGPLFDLAVAESGDAGHFIPCPFPWKGHARRAGGWPKTKRAKPTSGATRHLLPAEGGRSGENYLLPSRGRGMPEGQGVGRRRKRVKPTSGATRHLLPEEGGRSGKSHLPPFPWKGARRRMRAGLSGIVILYPVRRFISMRRTIPIASSAPAH